MLSVFVIARDNSGNHVASRVQTISVTPGNSTPAISLAHGPEQIILSAPDIVVGEPGPDGSLTTITLPVPVGKNFLGTTLTEVVGSGTRAELESILDQDHTSEYYGQVTGFNVLNGGSGYDKNITISIIPVLRLVGYGQPAEIDIGRTVDNPPFQAPIYYAKFDLKKDVNGNPKTGYGYAISPRWEIQSSSGSWFTHTDFDTLTNYERLPLVESNFTTGGVAPINDGVGVVLRSSSPHRGSRLLGGFTQSPCFFEYEVVETGEPLHKVQFFVNGRLIDEKVTPPFAFSFIADDPGEYDIYASAIDKSSNVVTSKPNKVDVRRYNGSGVSSGLSLESNYSIAADTKTILTATASSEFGVAEVEFYINEKSYAKVTGNGNLEAFIAEVDLGGLNQGQHALTLVARDFAGNISGTFDPSLTNIESRQDETFTITAKLPSSVPPNIELIYPPVLKRITASSTLYFQATAFDEDGRLSGVQFYVNGEPYGDEIPHNRIRTQLNYPFGISWTPPGEGVYLINAVARDSSGNKSLSATSTVTVTDGDNMIPNVILTPLNSEYEAGQSVFLSAQISDEANSSTGYGVIEDVQFFVNGSVLKDFNNTGPFFEVWNPESGIYEVYAMAKDNEGNHAISDVNTVFVGVFDDFDELPQLSSLNPELKPVSQGLSISRETVDGLGVISSIHGLPYETLQNCALGEIIRLSSDLDFTNKYSIYQIMDDGTLKLHGDITPEDEIMLTTTNFIRKISVYTTGSLIYLSLKPEVDDTNFDSVTFYVDGTEYSTDNQWPFSTVFAPTQEGNYTISVVAENQFQNKTLYSERIWVETSTSLGPSGGAEIMPDVTQRNNPRAYAITLGSQISVRAAYEDLEGEISRVEFYLNGNLVRIDYEKPYYHIFTPSSESISIVDQGYEMAIVGIDDSGNRLTNLFQGVIGGSTVLPTTTVKAPTYMEEFSNGQAVEFKVEVVGSLTPRLLGVSSDPLINGNPNLQRFPRRMAIMANGENVSIASETGWGTGVFVGEWVSDINYANDEGVVELYGTMLAENLSLMDDFQNTFPYSPTIFSDVQLIKVVEPNLASDPQSAINQTFNDFLGVNPSQAEVANAYTEEMSTNDYLFNNNEFLKWAARLSSRDSFQNMVDSIGGYHIMTGQWPLATKVDEILNTYSATPNNNSDGSGDADGDGFSLLQEIRFQTDDQDPTDFPAQAFRIESFIDETLVSEEFTDLHGTIAPLSPPPGFDYVRTVNYDENRRNFVKTFFKNKYHRLPTPSQELQGAHRLASFNPNSPEALYEQQQEQMRQIAMYASFGFGGNRGTGGTTTITIPSAQLLPLDQYLNPGGQQATLFLTNLIAEKLIDNQPMIYGAENKRSFYETAALIIALWADNLEVLTDELISHFHSLSTEEKISSLMKDRRYSDRFGGYSISRMATNLLGFSGWKKLDWFGSFNDDHFPWIYHASLGWVYVHGTSDDQVWFYLPDAGWLWTSEEIWEVMDETSNYLWLYEQSNSRWVAYYLEQPAGKIFWNPQSKSYFTYE